MSFVKWWSSGSGSSTLITIEQQLQEYVDSQSQAAGINKKFSSMPEKQRVSFATFESDEHEAHRNQQLANIEQLSGMSRGDASFYKVYHSALLEVFGVIFAADTPMNALLYFQAGVKTARCGGTGLCRIGPHLRDCVSPCAALPDTSGARCRRRDRIARAQLMAMTPREILHALRQRRRAPGCPAVPHV